MVSAQALEYELNIIVYKLDNSIHFAETKFVFLKIGMLMDPPS